MSIQVLVSTMNQTNIGRLVRRMKVKNYVVINQMTFDNKPQKDLISDDKILSFREQGLSKSRNKAIANSTADICVIADDDMYYVNDYESIIVDAYRKYRDADIIAFFVDSKDKRQKKKLMKEGKVGLLRTMKIASGQITFKRKRIADSGISFDESFGVGTKKYMGEENIFLFDCHKHGLKIYYVPIKIATLELSESTWFMGHSKYHFKVAGSVYFRMSKTLYPLLIIQFAIRRRSLYVNEVSTYKAIKYMFEGAFNEK